MYTTPEFGPAPSRKWYEIWWYVLTHPSAQTFREISREPGASVGRAFLWVVVTSLISSVIGSILGAVFNPTRIDVFAFVCSFITVPVFAILGLAISGAIYHFVARLFGGTGSWERLVYSFATFLAPFALVGSLFSIFFTPFLATSMPAVSPGGELVFPSVDPVLATPAACLISLVSVVFGIYSIVLYINAIDGVENIGTGRAIMTYFAPTIVVIVLCLCLTAALVALLVPLSQQMSMLGEVLGFLL